MKLNKKLTRSLIFILLGIYLFIGFAYSSDIMLRPLLITRANKVSKRPPFPTGLETYLLKRAADGRKNDVTGIKELWDSSNKIFWEFGCGDAGIALEIARQNPDLGVIATDRFESHSNIQYNGYYRDHRDAYEKGELPAQSSNLANLVVTRAEYYTIVGELPYNSIDYIFILNPDRHIERTIINNIDDIESKLKPGGKLFLKPYFTGQIFLIESQDITPHISKVKLLWSTSSGFSFLSPLPDSDSIVEVNLWTPDSEKIYITAGGLELVKSEDLEVLGVNLLDSFWSRTSSIRYVLIFTKPQDIFGRLAILKKGNSLEEENAKLLIVNAISEALSMTQGEKELLTKLVLDVSTESIDAHIHEYWVRFQSNIALLLNLVTKTMARMAEYKDKMEFNETEQAVINAVFSRVDMLASVPSSIRLDYSLRPLLHCI